MTTIGTIGLWTGFLASLLAVWAYFRSARANQDSPAYKDALGLARQGFVVMGLAVIAASAYLLYNLITCNFQIVYVAEHAARELSLAFRIAAFWEGQEGTFLLWAFFNALLGFMLIRKAGKYESWTMFFFSWIQIFLLGLLLAKNPFTLLPSPPENGSGLNPLLQDYWMVIHPPVMFVGFAAMAIPFVFAMAALLRREYEEWIPRTFPWALLSWTSLGTGIFVGGYWAYRTLGWGGYWGWDPVENASFVPWIANTALIHGMVKQKATGSMAKSNLFLAIMSFILVLYGTFLTRSGILGDFSVHSFVAPGMLIYWLLIAGTTSFALVGLGLLAWRSREIPVKESHDSVLSRNFGFFLGIILLMALALLTLLGTSAPLITRIGGKPSNVSTQFYTWISTPLGVLIALLIAAVPVMAWRKTEPDKFRERVLWPVSLGIVGTAICFVAGVRNPALALITLFSLIALFTNGVLGYRIIRGGSWTKAAGYLVHVGVALMLLGIVGSAGYSQTQMLTLTGKAPARAFGYEFRFDGWTKDAMNRDALKIQVARDGASFIARPVLAVYERGGEPMVIKHPDITKKWNYDLYVSPDNYEPAESPNTLHLQQGKPQEMAGYRITFRKFDVPDMKHMQSGGDMHIGAVLDIEYKGQKTTAKPIFVFDPHGSASKHIAAKLPGPPGALIHFENMNVESRHIELRLEGVTLPASKKRETVSLEVSKKPMMNVLLLGTWIVVLGGLLSVRRRALEVAGDVAASETSPSEETIAPHKRKGKGKPVPVHSSVKR
ncbi:MAG: cytochrome c biogenesis protein CcsA [Armatimonadetes bacterium]|nr:cytochrome c biogenesis protein CcsA [Armatimonadota bacterium]